MGKREITKAIVGTLLLGAPVAGLAQAGWVPGSEITGQSVQVETNGVTNTVFFDPGGVARIPSPDAQRKIGPGNVGCGKRPIVPDHGRGARMLALFPAVPSRAADQPDQ